MTDETGAQASPGSRDHGGPYLAAAFLCEKVLTEQDGVISAIRIVDRIYQSVTAVGVPVPQTMPPLAVNLTALLSFKSGQARGRGTIRVTLEQPSGLPAGLELRQPVFFEGEDRGVNVILNLGMQLAHEGLYWFHVFLDDRFVTKIPLRLVYQPMAAPARPGT